MGTDSGDRSLLGGGSAVSPGNVPQCHPSPGDSAGGVTKRAAAAPGQVGSEAAAWCNRAITARNLRRVPAVQCGVQSKLGGEGRYQARSTSRMKTSINPLVSLLRQRSAPGSLLRPSPAISLYQSIINHCQVKDILIINES